MYELLAARVPSTADVQAHEPSANATLAARGRCSCGARAHQQRASEFHGSCSTVTSTQPPLLCPATAAGPRRPDSC